MASNVQICNLALGMIGAGRIASLEDGSIEGRSCTAVFELLRDEVQEAHAWTFNKARAELARLDETPSFGYLYAYALPSDCLRVLKVDGDTFSLVDQQNASIVEAYGIQWEIEGRKLLTDAEEVKIQYLKRGEDPSQFTASFVMAFAARLAVDLAMTVAKSYKLADSMQAVYKQRLAVGEATNADTDRTAPYQSTSYVSERQ